MTKPVNQAMLAKKSWASCRESKDGANKKRARLFGAEIKTCANIVSTLQTGVLIVGEVFSLYNA